jgi:hypothetical protein
VVLKRSGSTLVAQPAEAQPIPDAGHAPFPGEALKK